MRALKTTIATLATIVLVIACSRTEAATPRIVLEQPSYWPTQGWRTSTPEEQGVDSQSLLQAIDFIEKEQLNMHSLLVIRNGYIIADVAFHPFAPNSKHDIASVTKSFTSTLIGVALGNGHIESLQQPLLSSFPNRTAAHLDTDKRAVTLEHLLTMSSGLKCRTWPGEITLFRMMQSPDWVQYMLDLPMKSKPGARFKYSSGGVHLLSAVLHESTGMNALEFARENLFEPLGISDVIWPTDQQGINNHGWGDMKMTPHDMAKLGFLYLHDGVWDGRQVLPPGWVEEATSSHISPTGSSLSDGYGYVWWLDSSGFYSALGRGGQRITVVPEKNMIVVLTAGLPGQDAVMKEAEMVRSIIIPGAKSAASLPPNPDAVARLEAKIRQAATIETSASPPPPLPETAKRISGQTFACEPALFNIFNVFGLKTFSLTFKENDEAVLRMRLASVEGQTELEVPVGLDNIPRISPGRYGLPTAAKGFWKSDKVFVAEIDEAGNINQLRISAKFKGDRVEVAIQENTGLPSGKYHGRLQ